MEIPTELEAQQQALGQLLELAQGDPRLYEQCIALMESMLAQVSPAAYPTYCSTLLQNLGNAYWRLPSEDEENSIRQAMACFQRAFKICSQEQSSREYRRALTHLGFAYASLPSGGRLENLRQAIDCYRQALSACDLISDAQDYGMVQNAMGAAYYAMPLGEGAENLRQAVACYAEALRVCTIEAAPLRHAMIRQNLGEAYARLPTGDRTENLLAAIECYRACLPLRPRERDPLGWAGLQTSLGDAYCQVWAGSRRQNLLAAIECYEAALDVFGPEAEDPRARILVNLGNAYYLLPAKDRAEPLQRALACFQEALPVFCDSDPWQYAAVQNDIGMVEADWPGNDRAGHLQNAVACYREALAIYESDTNVLEYPSALGNLGSAYGALWELGQQDAWELAVACLEGAAMGYGLETAPAGYRKVTGELGQLHMKAGRWPQAHAALDAAIAANERLYEASATDPSRQSELAEAGGIYRDDAYCLARMGRFDEAVELLESGRTRALMERLARDRAALDLIDAASRQAFDHLRDRIRALEAETRSLGESSRSFVALSQELRSARADLSSLLSLIRQQSPELRTGVSLGEIPAVVPVDRPLVYILTASAGALAMIVPYDVQHLVKEHIVWLDDFDEQRLDDLLYGREDEPGLLDVVGDRSHLLEALPRLCEQLGEELMAPVVQALVALGYRRCLLVPCGRLSLLPLHAASLADGRYLDDTLEVAYAPSARALESRGNGTPADTARRLLAIVDPPHSVKVDLGEMSLSLPLPRLSKASTEIEDIANQFAEAAVLDGALATRSAVLQHAPAATHLHFACHGHFALRDPLRSGLALAGEEMLTVRDVLDEIDLALAQLVTLAACQTALSELERVPDECVGLPVAFLLAGVSTVVASLWEVSDAATSLLLARFYRLHLAEGLAPSAALPQAQRWLRELTVSQLATAGAPQETAPSRAHPDEKPFAHPYYWAAFTVTGGVRS